jgi:hypothetical protein
MRTGKIFHQSLSWEIPHIDFPCIGKRMIQRSMLSSSKSIFKKRQSYVARSFGPFAFRTARSDSKKTKRVRNLSVAHLMTRSIAFIRAELYWNHGLSVSRESGFYFLVVKCRLLLYFMIKSHDFTFC